MVKVSNGEVVEEGEIKVLAWGGWRLSMEVWRFAVRVVLPGQTTEARQLMQSGGTLQTVLKLDMSTGYATGRQRRTRVPGGGGKGGEMVLVQPRLTGEVKLPTLEQTPLLPAIRADS